MERIATEFNQLQFHAVQSKGMPLLDKVRPVSVGWCWAVDYRESHSLVLSSSMPGTDCELQCVDLMLRFWFGGSYFPNVTHCGFCEKTKSHSLSFRGSTPNLFPYGTGNVEFS